jgi:hypothetical protein
MLSSSNLRDLDDAGLRFIVGCRVTKAPKDLQSHFRWHGTAFTDGQIIDTITPRDQRGTAAGTSDPNLRAEPVWDPATHARSWRAVWAYSTKRAVRDSKTLTLQENKARAVIAEEKATRTLNFDPGLAPRPKNHACQGATEEMQGTPFTSHWSETGFVVSGVEATSIRSTLSCKIRSLATTPARAESDWLSFTTMVTLLVPPPIFRPAPSAFRTVSITKVSASPKPASGPVCGLT